MSNKVSRPIPDLVSLMPITNNRLFVTGTKQSPLLMSSVTQFAGGAGCGRPQDGNTSHKVLTQVGGCPLILLSSLLVSRGLCGTYTEPA